eukprot:7682298-Lingulodinium_polyedra.AAC.1
MVGLWPGNGRARSGPMVVRQTSVLHTLSAYGNSSCPRRSPAHAYDQGRRISSSKFNFQVASSKFQV